MTEIMHDKWGSQSQRPGIYTIHLGYDEKPNDPIDHSINHKEALRELDKQIVRVLHLQGGETILDVGCGTGNLVFEIKEAYPEVTVVGINNSLKELKRGVEYKRKTGFANTHFVLQNFELPGFRPQSFNAIIMEESFLYVRDRRQMIARLYELLSPGGRLLIADNFLALEKKHLFPKEQEALDIITEAWECPIFFTQGSILELLRETGFRTKVTDGLLNILPSAKYVRKVSEDKLADNGLKISDQEKLLRESYIAYYELLEQGMLKYLFILAFRN